VKRFGTGPGDSRMTKLEVCQKLDGLGELNTPEAQSDAHALAQTGVPIILPLSQIWAEGQVTKAEYREENFGSVYVLLAGFLSIGGFVRFYSFQRDYGWVTLFAAVAVGVSVAGFRLRREAAVKAKTAQRRAYLAGQVISNITDPECAVRLLESCYGLNGNQKIKLILIEPAAIALPFLLPMADESAFANPSRLACLSIRQILSKDPKSNLMLAKEVIELVKKAEMTGFVAEIDKLTKPWAPPSLRLPAEECSRILHEAIEERKRTGVLLRPSSGPDDEEAILLRPVNTSRQEQHEILVRAIQDEQ
jgi:hypothetical protein